MYICLEDQFVAEECFFRRVLRLVVGLEFVLLVNFSESEGKSVVD